MRPELSCCSSLLSQMQMKIAKGHCSLCLWPLTCDIVNDMFSYLVRKGREQLQTLNGQDPHTIYIPASKDNLAWLLSEDTNFQIALADYSGQLSTHYFSQHLWTEMGNVPLYTKHCCSMILSMDQQCLHPAKPTKLQQFGMEVTLSSAIKRY